MTSDFGFFLIKVIYPSVHIQICIAIHRHAYIGTYIYGSKQYSYIILNYFHNKTPVAILLMWTLKFLILEFHSQNIILGKGTGNC